MTNDALFRPVKGKRLDVQECPIRYDQTAIPARLFAASAYPHPGPDDGQTAFIKRQQRYLVWRRPAPNHLEAASNLNGEDRRRAGYGEVEARGFWALPLVTHHSSLRRRDRQLNACSAGGIRVPSP